MKKTIMALLLCAIMVFCFGCLENDGGKDMDKYDKATVEAAMPDDAQHLFIEKEGVLFQGFGAELDPHFLNFNVGRTGKTGSGVAWECRSSDWDSVFVPRIEEMNLCKLRIMLLPSWFAVNETVYRNKTYDFNNKSFEMLEKILDLATRRGMYVNITMWGIDAGAGWMGEPFIDGMWMTIPKDDTVFAEVFADALDYLINKKGYDCIKEVTPYNEPDTVYNPYLGKMKGFPAYAALCRKLDEVLRAHNMRNKVKFSLSDDANNISWLTLSVSELSDIADLFNSHTYSFGKETPNEIMLSDNERFSFGKIRETVKESGKPFMFGEFGTNTTLPPNGCTDKNEPSRGIDIARVAVNALNSGAAGLNYWGLYSQFYGSTTNFSEIMSMGLWGFADEEYECRPVYYAYSLLTRFTEIGSIVYPIESHDRDISAVALKNKEGGWTYIIVNTSALSKKISFGNLVSEAGTMNLYTYSANENYKDGKQIAADGVVTSLKRVTVLSVAGDSVTVIAGR